jgi:hypothetical protein
VLTLEGEAGNREERDASRDPMGEGTDSVDDDEGDDAEV